MRHREGSARASEGNAQGELEYPLGALGGPLRLAWALSPLTLHVLSTMLCRADYTDVSLKKKPLGIFINRGASLLNRAAGRRRHEIRARKIAEIHEGSKNNNKIL